jgi:hypothetical protein
VDEVLGVHRFAFDGKVVPVRAELIRIDMMR